MYSKFLHISHTCRQARTSYILIPNILISSVACKIVFAEISRNFQTTCLACKFSQSLGCGLHTIIYGNGNEIVDFDFSVFNFQFFYWLKKFISYKFVIPSRISIMPYPARKHDHCFQLVNVLIFLR